MAPSSSAPFGSSSKSPRSPSDRTPGRPGASSWSTTYSRTSSTRTERSYDDEEEDDYEEDLNYGNKQAVAGPSSSPYDPRLARPIASPLAPAPHPGEMARWQVPPPNNTMAPYAYDNRIQSALIVGQNQALYQNTYAPAPHISNRDTGNTNTSQVTDAYNDKSRHRVEVTNMTIHNHYHAPQSAPPTYPSSPPISASASGSSAPSAYPSAPKEPRRRSRSRTREVEYFPLQNDIPVYESAPAMQREPSSSTSVPYPDFRQGPPASEPLGRTRPSGGAKRREDSLLPPGPYGRASSDIVRPERSQAPHSRSESVDVLNSEMTALYFDKGEGKQGGGSDLKSSGNQMNLPISSTSGRAKRTTDRQEETECSGPPAPPPKDIEFIEGRQTTAAPRSKEVALSPRDANIPTTPLGEPLGYPALKEFTGVSEGQWVLHSGIENHIPAYMSLSLLGSDKKTIALWQPQPSLNRRSGRKRGIEVGDVVYLNDSGKIHVVFNIFRSSRENRDDGAWPPPESYYRHINTTSLDEKPDQESLQNRKCYFSKNIVRLGLNDGTERYLFQAKKGAKNEGILVLPRGGIKAFIPLEFFDENRVKEFFCRYSPSWYHHVKATRPRLRNGDLFLVSQSYSAKTFGMAALALKKPAKEALSIEFGYDSRSLEYHWESRDCWWMSSVSRPTSPGDDTLHCLGVAMYSILLDEKTWTTHFDPKPSMSDPPQSPTSSSQNSPTDLSTLKSDSSPGGRVSTFSKMSPKYWIGRKSDKRSGNGDTGSIQQLIPEGYILLSIDLRSRLTSDAQEKTDSTLISSYWQMTAMLERNRVVQDKSRNKQEITT